MSVMSKSCFYRRHLLSHLVSFSVAYLGLFALKLWLCAVSDGLEWVPVFENDTCLATQLNCGKQVLLAFVKYSLELLECVSFFSDLFQGILEREQKSILESIAYGAKGCSYAVHKLHRTIVFDK